MSARHHEWQHQCERDDLARPTDEYIAASHARHCQNLSATAISKALQDAGFNVAVVVTDSDRLQGAIIEAETMLAHGMTAEAKRILREALNEQ